MDSWCIQVAMCNCNLMLCIYPKVSHKQICKSCLAFLKISDPDPHKQKNPKQAQNCTDSLGKSKSNWVHWQPKWKNNPKSHFPSYTSQCILSLLAISQAIILFLQPYLFGVFAYVHPFFQPPGRTIYPSSPLHHRDPSTTLHPLDQSSTNSTRLSNHSAIVV